MVNTRSSLRITLKALLVWTIGRLLWNLLRLSYRKRRFRVLTRKMPNPFEKHWFWGSHREFLRNIQRIGEFRREMFDTYGKEKLITLAADPLLMRARGVIITRDPKVVQHILKDNINTWIKPNSMDLKVDLFKEWLRDGIFIISHGPNSEDKGNLWFMQRKIASGIFTANNFRDFMQTVFHKHAHHMIDILSQQSQGESFDIQRMFFRYTMDAIGQIGFGVEMDTLSGKEDPFAVAFDEAHHLSLHFLQSRMAYIGMLSLLSWPVGDFCIKLLRQLDPLSRRFNRDMKIIDQYTYDIIDKRKNTNNDGKDLLSLFMKVEDENGKPLSRDLLRDVVNSFILAGRDTTACTLSWTFYMLSQWPNVRDKLINEIDELLQGEEPTYENLKPLKYLNGVIYECLRLYPPVPFNFKEAATDDVLPDGTKIPEGTIGIYSPYLMGRCEGLWPDPLEVRPERWIDTPQPSQYEFPVFQAGPRICLGLSMAVIEAKILTVMLLQKFSLELVPNQTIGPARMLTMSIAGKLLMTVKPRALE